MLVRPRISRYFKQRKNTRDQIRSFFKIKGRGKKNAYSFFFYEFFYDFAGRRTVFNNRPDNNKGAKTSAVVELGCRNLAIDVMWREMIHLFSRSREGREDLCRKVMRLRRRYFFIYIYIYIYKECASRIAAHMCNSARKCVRLRYADI